MSIEDLLSVCSLLVPAVGMWFLRVHLRETEHDRQRAARRPSDVLTLRAEETIVGVIDRSHGPAIFLVHETPDGTHDV